MLLCTFLVLYIRVARACKAEINISSAANEPSEPLIYTKVEQKL